MQTKREGETPPLLPPPHSTSYPTPNPVTEAATPPSGKTPGSLETGNRCPTWIASFSHWREETDRWRYPVPHAPKPAQELSRMCSQKHKSRTKGQRDTWFSRRQGLCLPEVFRGSSISFCRDALSVDKSKLMVIKGEALGGEVC